MSTSATRGPLAVGGHDVRILNSGWSAAAAPPGTAADPATAAALDWIPAAVPGTAAGALRDAGRWAPGRPAPDLDAEDWWFRTTFEAPAVSEDEEVWLAFDGLATIAEIWLNGQAIAAVDSMFEPAELDVGAYLRPGANDLALRFRALAPVLEPARRPRARWRTRVAAADLRFVRTMLLGRAPGFAPGPAAVGPWRPVRLERRRGVAVVERVLRPRLDGATGVLELSLLLRGLGGVVPTGGSLALSDSGGETTVQLARDDREGFVRLHGSLSIPAVERWWPHTHGIPHLYDARVRVEVSGERVVMVDFGRIGFRDLRAPADPAREGLALEINGVPVFARGAVWTPADPVNLTASDDDLRAALELVRDAGMNMLRVVATGAYEDERFHDLCDELGILVWQDLMFANFDYPFADQEFHKACVREVRRQLAGLAGRPSFAVLCGNSEIEQQAAMMGLDPGLGRLVFMEETVPALLAACGGDAAYVRSAPCGGVLPFRNAAGVANYFGIGGYRRDLGDARHANVRFASECLAVANVPDDLTSGGDGDWWRAGVPRDTGADWDFADVRDHYLGMCMGEDAMLLRNVDPERYLRLSREVTGELMAEVFGEWRRDASPCRGGIVLWLRDLAPGSGWGLLDHRGLPKAAYHHLRRALAPLAVWTVDEGLDGIAIHVANDRGKPFTGRLRVALYASDGRLVEDGAEDVEVAAHGALHRDAEGLLGRFADASWAYRFGPAAHEVLVASLEHEDRLVSQAFRLSPARPQPVSVADLGLQVTIEPGARPRMFLRSERLVWGVRIDAPGHRPNDDAFSLEPGRVRSVSLRPIADGTALSDASVTALNLVGAVQVTTG